MKKKCLLILSFLPLIMSCSLFGGPKNNDTKGEENITETPSKEDETNPSENEDTPKTDPKENEDETKEEQNHKADVIDPSMSKGGDVFDALFTYGNKISFTLDFTNQSLLKLQEYGATFGNNDNFVKNEMYHPCTVTLRINDKVSTYYEVGARMKGNTSRNTRFLNSDGTFNENEFFHFKLNFSETFDNKDDNDYYINPWTNSDAKAEREDRKLGKMKKLDFKWNRNHDATFTKELYVLDSFRRNGVVSQHGNLAEVTLKTEKDTRTMVYQILESVDKQMIKKVKSDDYSGDLYKCVYQNSRADLSNTDNLGVEKTGFKPTYGLKTNESKSDMSVFKTFVEKINTKNISGEEYFNLVSEYLDVDEFLKYSALCWVAGLPDDLRNNANNYYLYFGSDNKPTFIPYDNDRCLGIRNGWDKDLKNLPWNHDRGTFEGDNWNYCPLVHRFLDGASNNSHKVHKESQDKFYEYCVKYAEDVLDVNKFEEFTKHFEGIAPSIDIKNAGSNNDSFETYAVAKKATLIN